MKLIYVVSLSRCKKPEKVAFWIFKNSESVKNGHECTNFLFVQGNVEFTVNATANCHRLLLTASAHWLFKLNNEFPVHNPHLKIVVQENL